MDAIRNMQFLIIVSGILLLFHCPVYSYERNLTTEYLHHNYDLQVLNRKSATYTAFNEIDFALYTKWSNWSKCSRKCLTRRFRRCKYKDICGDKVLRQRAYCFPRTPDNFCERWFTEQNQITQEVVPVKPRATYRHNRYLQQQQLRQRLQQQQQQQQVQQQQPHGLSNYVQPKKETTKRSPEYVAQNLNCGFPLGRRNGTRKSILSLLKIIGGRSARRSKWPWQVAVLNRHKEAFCGGTLISPSWVITAAHCVRKHIYVRLGEYDLEVEEEEEIEYAVKKTIIHPKYNKQTVDNDIAMLMLPRSIQPSKHAAFACLPSSFQPLPDIRCTIIGWGKMNNDDDAGSDVLKEAEVPIISTEECRNIYYDYSITKNMFCAGHRHGRIDTCAGDSGGPLICRDAARPNQPWTIFGITSFGDGCGKQNKYGIYSKIPNYVDWIWSVINCNGNCIPRNRKSHHHPKNRRSNKINFN